MKKKNFFKSQKAFWRSLDYTLAGRIGKSMSIALFITFFVIILTTTLIAGRVLSSAGDNTIKGSATSTANQVQKLVSNTEAIASNLATYMDKYYTMKDAGYTNMAGAKNPAPKKQNSIIYSTPIDEISVDAEKYITEMARNTVINDSSVVSIGVMLEPYAFNPALKNFSFYLDPSIGQNGKVKPAMKCEDYTGQKWYKWAKELKSTFSDPYPDDNNNIIISYMRAIEYKGKFLGIIAVDVNVNYLKDVVIKDENYKSLYNAVYNNHNVCVFNTKNDKFVMKNISDIYTKNKELKKVESQMEKGKSFNLKAKIDSNSSYNVYYTPIKAGNTIWWSATGVKTFEKNLTRTITIHALIFLSIIALIVIIRILSKQLTNELKPIDSLVDVADKISEGELDIDVNIASSSEIGKLATAFKRMIERLRVIIEDIDNSLEYMAEGKYNQHTSSEDIYVGEFNNIYHSIYKMNNNMRDTLYEIIDGAEQVSVGANYMKTSAETLAKGTNNQTFAISELTSTIEKVTDLSEKSAQTALSVCKQVTIAGQEATVGQNDINALTDAMERINETSKNIQKIIGAIEDIASQTNLLALNASIEAARAGESGKGFAVVADQIGKLAGDSAKSAIETRELVNKSLNEVKEGNNITKKAASSFEKIINDMYSFGEETKGVSDNSAEQAEMLREIRQEIEQISSVIESNSASAEESSATSQELKSQSERLKDLVNKFELE